MFGVRVPGRGRATPPAAQSVSPGVGGGHRKSAACVGSAAACAAGGLQSAPATLDVRVTEVIDPASFWAQIGEAKALAEFDNVMTSLSRWCSQYGASATSLPKVGEVIAVKGEEPGSWMRAKVSRQASESDVEVLYVDTGATGRVSLGSVCGKAAPQLYSIPSQAFQCSLYGIQPSGGSELWSEVAIARFSELTTQVPAKAKPLELGGHSHTCSMYLYVRIDERWLNVAEVLVAEGLAQVQCAANELVEKALTLPGALEDEEEEGGEEEEGEEEEDGEEEEEGGASCDLSTAEASSKEGEEKGQENVVFTHKGNNEEEDPHSASILPTNSSNKSSPTHFDFKGPLVVKGVEKEEDEVEVECPTSQEREDVTDDSTSVDESEEEWDESLLHPLQQLSTSQDSQYGDTFTPSHPNGSVRQKLPNFSVKYFEGGRQRNEFYGLFRRGGRGGGRGGGRRGGVSGGSWSGHGTRDGGMWRGAGGEREGSGGDWWGKKRGIPTGRGGPTYRGGGRGRPSTRPEQEQEQDGGVKEGGPPGGMKGVKVTKGDGVGEGLQQTAPAKGGPLATRSASPPPAPPSTQPVELFLRESNTGRGVGGTGGGGPGLLPPRITTETAKNEIQWHTWRLECHIKKMVEALTEENSDSFGSKIQELLSTQSSAQKLISLPGSRGPVWPVLSCLLAEGVRRNDGTEKAIVVALRSLVGVLSVDVCQLLQAVVQEMCDELCERPSASVQSKQLFCNFIGKLFLDASYSRSRDYASVMGRIVREFLNSWCKCPVDCPEDQLLSQVQCFAFLCEQIGPTIDVTNRETLQQYFYGVVDHHILNPNLPRSVCRFLLNLDRKREGGWKEDCLEPTTPPSAFSNDIPTHSANGQQVVHPIPVEGGVASQNGPWNKTMSKDLGGGYRRTLSDPQTSTTPSSLLHSIPPQHDTNGRNMSLHFQNSYTQTAPSGIQPLHSPHSVNVSYSTVHDMLQSLGCLHHLDSFKKAKISDVTLECSNTDTLRGGLKDVGLQPGEVIAVLDYLEKRGATLHTSPYSFPSDLSSPHHIGVPGVPTTQVLPYPTSNGSQTSPHYSNYPSTPPFAPPHPLPQPYTSSSTPPTTPSQQYPCNAASPYRPPHQYTSTPPNAPPRPPPQQYTSPPPQQYTSPPPQQYPSAPPTPIHGHQHSLHPIGSTTLPQFTPSYRASTRLPTPALTHRHSMESPGASSQLGNKKYGFGRFSCVLCHSQDHTTDQCPDRDSLFFRSVSQL